MRPLSRTSAGRLAFAIFLTLPLSGRALAANQASVLEASSSVPPGGPPGAIVQVRLRVQNTGTTTWRAGTAHRLGANSSGFTNQVLWSGFSCGGYVRNATDARAFLCHDVAPGATHDFQFGVSVPTSGTARLSVRMVQDGLEWFGETQTWTLTPAGGPDVVVDSVSLDPPRPKSGQSVRFISLVRNQGTASTPAGVVIGVGYLIDGRWVTYGVVSTPLAPGASATIGTHGGTWPAAAGSHTLEAFVDDVNRFSETDESNNKRALIFTVESGTSCAAGALPTPSDRWKLEIFGNRALTGSPVEQRYEAPGTGGFTFDWGSGRASPCTADDDFGIRFSRRIEVATSGEYEFTTRTDDGVRLWVDGQLVIDRWMDQAPTLHRGRKFLAAGGHDLRMDYYENGGGAYASLQWAKTSAGGMRPEDLYAINIDPANPKGDPSADAVRSLGARWVRIEYKASHGLSFYDSKIAKYRNAGIRVLLIVDYASIHGKPGGTAGSDADWSRFLQSFDSGLRTIAGHFRDGVDGWQIWNEPDLLPQPGYDPWVPPRHFGTMLRSSVSTIRQFSTRPIVTGGLASGDPSYLAQARDASGGLTVDAVAVHPYGQRAPDDWPHPSWGFGNMSALFDRYLAFGKPLWVTEIGVNTTDQGFQADYLENVYALARDRYANRVQAVFWFCWSDGMVPPYGLLDSNQSAKPSYHQYRAVAPPP